MARGATGWVKAGGTGRGGSRFGFGTAGAGAGRPARNAVGLSARGRASSHECCGGAGNNRLSGTSSALQAEVSGVVGGLESEDMSTLSADGSEDGSEEESDVDANAEVGGGEEAG